MSQGTLWYQPIARVFQGGTNCVPNAKAYFYLAGTLTPTTVYADVALTVPLTQPVVADSNGVFVEIFLTPGVAYKVDVQTSSGVSLAGYPADNQMGAPAPPPPPAYLEGTWAPVIGGATSTAGQTYTNQEGRYIKIGSMVWAACNVVLSAKGTITGAVQIQGLPFTCETGTLQFYPGSIFWTVTVTSFVSMTVFVPQNTNVISIIANTAAATSGGTGLTTTDIGNTTGFRCMVMYRSAS